MRISYEFYPHKELSHKRLSAAVCVCVVHRLLSRYSFTFISAVTLNGIMGSSLNSVEFYKYRRKCVCVFKCILALFILLQNSLSKADEVYQCNNQTQTCITESELGEVNDQQLFQLPTPLSSWAEIPQCRGKILLSQSNGFISDGPGNYSLDTKCTWVVQSSQPNSTITYFYLFIFLLILVVYN